MKSSIAEWRNYSKRYQVTEEGEVFSYSKVFVSAKRFAKLTPYFVALIKLDSGKMITSHVVDVEDDSNMKIGARVRPVFRKIAHDDDVAAITYGTKFVLVN